MWTAPALACVLERGDGVGEVTALDFTALRLVEDDTAALQAARGNRRGLQESSEPLQKRNAF